MFKVSEWLELKVLEVTPELTQLGSTLKEAEELRRSHHEVISKIQVRYMLLRLRGGIQHTFC